MDGGHESSPRESREGFDAGRASLVGNLELSLHLSWREAILEAVNTSL